jgi:hypothetical protein
MPIWALVDKALTYHQEGCSTLNNAVSLLVNAGANINMRSCREGKTLLHLAYEKHALSIARILLKHGANPTIKDLHGKTPSDYLDKHILSLKNIKVIGESILFKPFIALERSLTRIENTYKALLKWWRTKSLNPTPKNP